ncbi:MFS family permease [Bradyrhizobium japonicum]|uniref:MFS family permease n=1 Tax=Bradyrhizobium elkanii TaxID=29448 RepID=A0ABV4FBX2_BRAEL|nr:MFS transporter [Bradyrhizobium elkanii]MBP2432089.1 MFS family permease [Bradyrhizobium elkanii]MCP1734587.1 MFS family permease [Bradyrhizobium elkanii]MCP1752381.1 MFS family permease [Bradyrhizobium elkanii]MCP1978154.1 MFS family permease [Bradyrhizobium elkanii]MCS3569925.1 MFS family permease [Bradyrhizobium elkanii]
MTESTVDTLAPSVAAPGAVSPRKVFWATWFGWMLDGFDSSMYAYILVGALSELLPASGIEPSKANIGIYGGLLFSIFMLGWACSMIWGWAADRYGRVRIMCWTVLVYSLFTALCGLATGIVMFALFRFVAGFGIGGEWAAGTPLLQESVPENTRVRLAGWLHTATPTGLFLAAAVTLAIGSTLGWRGMFLLGILPALLIAYLRSNIPEPERSAAREQPSVAALFAGDQARTTWAAALMMACIIFGLWSSNFWAPTVISTKLVAAGATPAHAQEMGAVAGLITNVGTLIGCLLVPWLTTWLGSRRRTAVLFFIGGLISVVVCYEVAIEWLDSLTLFMVLLPVLGFFTNGVFGLFTIWLPEMFPSALRGSGSGFAFSMGRVLGAAGPTLIGALAARTGSFPLAISMLSLIYVVGLPLIALAPETAGKPLAK